MNPISLFDDSTIEKNPNTINDLSSISKINGLIYIPEYISELEELFLLKSLNSEVWLGDLKRRVQHYGYKYDYKARFIDYSMKIGNLPEWVMPTAIKLKEDKLINEIPDQLIINEYEPGQGIANHIDCEPCFGETIISLSLGSNCVMLFKNKDSNEEFQVLLEPKSLVVLKEDARYKWTHGIVGKKTDIFNNVKYKRGTRVSLTFRNIILRDNL